MANKIKSHGTSLLQEISSVYTAIPGVISIDISGEKTKTYDATDLGTGQYEVNAISGRTTPPTISFELWWDPDDSTQGSFEALKAAPVATNFKVTYTDATPTSEIYSGVGFGMDKKVAGDGTGVKASCEIVTTGAPT